MLLTELYTLNCVQGLANIVSLELTILGTVGAVALPTKTVSSTAPTVPKIVSSTVKKGAERTPGWQVPNYFWRKCLLEKVFYRSNFAAQDPEGHFWIFSHTSTN